MLADIEPGLPGYPVPHLLQAHGVVGVHEGSLRYFLSKEDQQHDGKDAPNGRKQHSLSERRTTKFADGRHGFSRD